MTAIGWREAGMTLLLVGALGCFPEPTVVDANSAAVTGQVVRPDGASPVPGALVTVQLISAVSNGQADLIGTSSGLTNEQGRFTAPFLTGYPVQTGSAQINVTPAPGQGLLVFDTAGIAVKILRGETPAESAYVQIQMKPRN